MTDVREALGGPVGLGCMGFSWVYGPQRQDGPDGPGDRAGLPDAAAVSEIRRAVDAGVRLLDTADLYGPFHNERLLGEAVRGRRDDVVIATKAGLRLDPSRGVVRDGSPRHLRASCEASLQRLGVDRVDLLYLHRADPAVPLEESWGALAELVGEGKARGLGLSEVTPEQIAAAHRIHPVSAVQSELSVWSREAEEGVLPYCADRHIAFVASCPLGRGYLAGQVRTPQDLPAGDGRPRWFPRYTADAMAANRPIADAVRSVAAELGATPAQVALAWVLSHGPHVVAVPGTTRAARAAENLAAAGLELTAGHLDVLDRRQPAVGSRY